MNSTAHWGEKFIEKFANFESVCKTPKSIILTNLGWTKFHQNISVWKKNSYLSSKKEVLSSETISTSSTFYYIQWNKVVAASSIFADSMSLKHDG